LNDYYFNLFTVVNKLQGDHKEEVIIQTVQAMKPDRVGRS